VITPAAALSARQRARLAKLSKEVSALIADSAATAQRLQLERTHVVVIAGGGTALLVPAAEVAPCIRPACALAVQEARRTGGVAAVVVHGDDMIVFVLDRKRAA
jgi:hypothetical protein